MNLRDLLENNESVQLEKSKKRLIQLIERELNVIRKESINSNRTYLYQTLLFDFKSKINEI